MPPRIEPTVSPGKLHFSHTFAQSRAHATQALSSPRFALGTTTAVSCRPSARQPDPHPTPFPLNPRRAREPRTDPEPSRTVAWFRMRGREGHVTRLPLSWRNHPISCPRLERHAFQSGNFRTFLPERKSLHGCEIAAQPHHLCLGSSLHPMHRHPIPRPVSLSLPSPGRLDGARVVTWSLRAHARGRFSLYSFP